jgi:hypothetical protein
MGELFDLDAGPTFSVTGNQEQLPPFQRVRRLSGAARLEYAPISAVFYLNH